MEEFLSREPVKRAIRTFIQAAAGYIVVHIVSDDFSTHEARMAFIVSVIAAGIAAMMNLDIADENESDNEGSDHNEKRY